MQIEIISFTQKGYLLAEQVKKILENTTKSQGRTAVRDGRDPTIALKAWCKIAFEQAQLLIFIGAAGIAVRTIAPFVKDKFSDPAVLVLDEAGSFVIPILSGHMGGGNEFAVSLAEKLYAVAVLTTATDINGVFAVDEFARKNHLAIADRSWAKEISAAILRGEEIGFHCEGNIIGRLPGQLIKTETDARITVGIHRENRLYPKAVAIGIGCKKGKTTEEIEGFVRNYLDRLNIALDSILCVASVDLKQNESGLCQFCQRQGLPFRVFSSEQLASVPGTFPESEFVKGITGVGNVCQRAAFMALQEEVQKEDFPKGQDRAGGAQKLQSRISMIQEKVSENGMTLAIAQKEWSVTFE